MGDKEEATSLLKSGDEDSHRNNGSAYTNGYGGLSEKHSMEHHDAPICSSEMVLDTSYEAPHSRTYSWDKMLLDDVTYQGGVAPHKRSRCGRAFARCHISKKTKSHLRNVKIAVMFLAIFVCSVFFALKEEVAETPEYFPVSESRPHLVNVSKLGGNTILKVKFKGPFSGFADVNTTENVTLRLLVYDQSQATPCVGEDEVDVYSISREHSLTESVYWEKHEKKYHLEDCGNDASFGLLYESNIEEPVTISVDYTKMPSLANQEVVWAAIILVGVYVLIGFELVHRTTAAMLGAFAVLAVLTSFNERPSLEKVMAWMDYGTLALLWGMMTVVAIFSETGFFDYCALLSYKWAKGKIWTLVTILCFFSGIVSAFLDNVTTILLLTPVTISLCEVLDIDPRPVLIAEVIFSNIGGTATAIGDPPNVIIVSNSEIEAAGIGFTVFTLHMCVGIVFCMIVGYGVLRLLYWRVNLHSLEPPAIRELKHEIEIWRQAATRIMVASKEERTMKALLMQKVTQLETQLGNQIYDHRHTPERDTNWRNVLVELEQKYQITDKVLLAKCGIVLAVMIILFFTYSLVNSIYLDLGWIAIIGAISLLLLADVHDMENVMHRVEWATLLFFAALFVLMEGLTELGLIEFIGNAVASVIEGVSEESRLTVALVLILWVSALASSFIDNIPFTTAMIPIILALAEREDLGLPLQPLVWALAFGACLGGNGTLIGASANVVCAGIADQHGYGFSFYDFFKVGFPMMLCTTFVAMIYLLICHVALEWH